MRIISILVAITTILILGNCSKSGPSTPSNPTPTITVPVMGGTTAITVITTTNARSGGTINSNGGATVTAKGVCWSTVSNPTIADNKTNDGFGTPPSGPHTYGSTITGLSPTTTYYVRAYATNSVGTGYGNEISFTTISTITLPTLTTIEVSAITASTAISGALIHSDGGSPVTARGVCWSTLPNPTTANSKTSDGTGMGAFTSNLAGLAEKTMYYVRSYAINSAGTAYGTEVTFSTTESGTVYIGVYPNKFYALNALTGQKKWDYTGPTSFSYVDPCFANGRVYTGGGVDGIVYCLDTANGNKIWSYQVGIGVSSAPTYDNGTIYVGAVDDYMYALDANTGMLKWRYLTGQNVSSSPVVQNNVVYFGSDDSKVYAVNATTGTLIWSYLTAGPIMANSAALVNGILYIGCQNGFFYALNSSNGTLAWNFERLGISFEGSSPTVVNNTVYFGSRAGLYALNATNGNYLWGSFLTNSFNTSPVVDNGKLFISTEGGDLLAVNASNGAELWRRTIYTNGSGPVVMNGVVYVGGGGMYRIHAIDIASSADKWTFPIPGTGSTSSPVVVTATSVKHSGRSGMQQ